MEASQVEGESNDAVMQEANNKSTEQIQSGLEVMADAASITIPANPEEALPTFVDLLKEKQNPTSALEVKTKKSFLPDVVELGSSTLLESVYSFKNAAEFYNVNNKPTKYSLYKQYTNGNKNGLLEMPLWHFKNWFQDLRFSDAVFAPKDEKSKVWHFRVIALDPSSTEIKNIAPIEAKLRFVTSLSLSTQACSKNRKQ